MNDCNEALVKIKMAFSSSSSNGSGGNKGKNATIDTDVHNASNLNVSNFGSDAHNVNGNSNANNNSSSAQYPDGNNLQAVDAFAIDLSLLEAEEEEAMMILQENQQDPQRHQQQNLLFTMDMDVHNITQQSKSMDDTMTMTLDITQPSQQVQQQEEEEVEDQWTAFDPHVDEEEEEKDQKEHPPQPTDFPLRSSDVSSIEMARDAGSTVADVAENARLSLLSNNDTNLNSSSMLTTNDDDNRALGAETEVGAVVEFEPTIEFQPNLPSVEDSNITPASAMKMEQPSILLSDDEDDESSSNKRRNPNQNPPRNNKRKRRKVVIDNDATELDSATLKSNLQDWSDCCRHRIHPAELLSSSSHVHVSTNENVRDRKNVQENVERLLLEGGNLIENLPTCLKELFHGENLSLHRFTKKKEIRMQEEMSREQQRQREEEEDIEEARMDAEINQKQDNQQEQQHEEDELYEAEQDIMLEGEELQAQEGEDEEQLTFEMTEDTMLLDESNPFPMEEGFRRHSLDSTFSLGAVNATVRVTSGQNNGNISNNSNEWHPHTTKVLHMLRQALAPDKGKEEEKEKGKREQLSYFSLVQHCKRHTVTSIFFELLQLKTLDYIDLEQLSSRGDVLISRGKNFDLENSSLDPVVDG